MEEFYLVCHSRVTGESMDFYLRSEDGLLMVDEPTRDMPFMVEPEAALALYQYLKEREAILLASQKQVIQNAIDVQDVFPDTDVSPRFELIPVLENET